LFNAQSARKIQMKRLVTKLAVLSVAAFTVVAQAGMTSVGFSSLDPDAALYFTPGGAFHFEGSSDPGVGHVLLCGPNAS
jgi:hypothetical protein